MSFFHEYTVLDPSGQTVSLFPEEPKFVLQDLKLYIPSKLTIMCVYLLLFGQ